VSGEQRKPPTPPKDPGGVSPKTTRVVVSVDTPAIKKAIAAAAARAVNEAAESLRLIREWCDTTEAETRAWLEKHNPECECEVGETRLEDVKAVRALLPDARVASDEDP
jgi:hypothetical protein